VLFSAGALLVLWLAAFIAWTWDIEGAGGWFDCWPACNEVQEAVGVAVFWAPLVLGGELVAIGLAVAAVRLTRRLR
jgi:hypothetical protein